MGEQNEPLLDFIALVDLFHVYIYNMKGCDAYRIGWT